MFDDNNRKPICRLRFNNLDRLVLGVFDHDKNETRHELASVQDIYGYRSALLAVARHYAGAEAPVTAEVG